MPPHAHFPHRFVSAFLTLLLVACGCGKKSTGPIAGGACDQKIAQARTALEDVLYAELNSDPDRPSDVDFQSAYQLYQQALVCSPTGGESNLGASVLGLLALSSDAEVNAAFDEWRAYLEAQTPFVVPPLRSRPLGVPLSFTSGRDALALPFELADWSVVALARPRAITADPQLSRIQAILDARVLPALTQAIARLAVAAADPNFRFIVTPRMQGDVDASPVEIDRTDVLALRAACQLLASACHVAVAYELGFTSYDSTGLIQAFQPGSGWLAFRSQGAAHMGSAGAALSGAVDDLDLAISSLLAESDSQDDDVIRIGPDALTRADAESIQVHLDDVRAGIAQGFTRVDDWDGNPGTPDVPLTIRLGALFTNPVPDWKALWPTYTPSVVRRPYRTRYNYSSGTHSGTVDAPEQRFYSAGADWYLQSGSPPDQFFSGDTLLRPLINEALTNVLQQAQSSPGWTGDFSGYATFSGNLDVGPQTVGVFYYAYYTTSTGDAFVPVITWQAATFDTWIWPDPTLRGLLPQMESTAELMETFGVTADQWSRVLVLDWTGGGGFGLLATGRHR